MGGAATANLLPKTLVFQGSCINFYGRNSCIAEAVKYSLQYNTLAGTTVIDPCCNQNNDYKSYTMHACTPKVYIACMHVHTCTKYTHM